MDIEQVCLLNVRDKVVCPVHLLRTGRDAWRLYVGETAPLARFRSTGGSGSTMIDWYGSVVGQSQVTGLLFVAKPPSYLLEQSPTLPGCVHVLHHFWDDEEFFYEVPTSALVLFGSNSIATYFRREKYPMCLYTGNQWKVHVPVITSEDVEPPEPPTPPTPLTGCAAYAALQGGGEIRFGVKMTKKRKLQKYRVKFVKDCQEDCPEDEFWVVQCNSSLEPRGGRFCAKVSQMYLLNTSE